MLVATKRLWGVIWPSAISPQHQHCGRVTLRLLPLVSRKNHLILKWKNRRGMCDRRSSLIFERKSDAACCIFTLGRWAHSEQKRKIAELITTGNLTKMAAPSGKHPCLSHDFCASTMRKPLLVRPEAHAMNGACLGGNPSSRNLSSTAVLRGLQNRVRINGNPE